MLCRTLPCIFSERCLELFCYAPNQADYQDDHARGALASCTSVPGTVALYLGTVTRPALAAFTGCPLKADDPVPTVQAVRNALWPPVTLVVGGGIKSGHLLALVHMLYTKGALFGRRGIGIFLAKKVGNTSELLGRLLIQLDPSLGRMETGNQAAETAPAVAVAVLG